MRALVYHGPGRRSWEEVPDPTIQDPDDAIVRINAVTICGTDLHILKGDVPTVEPGRILGHEAVGTVIETGSSVRTIEAGDRVLVSCITACGRCRFCREARYGQCLGGGGWILGHRIDGVQAQFARVPFADTSTHLLPPQVEAEAAVMLADILPTAYEVGVLNGRVAPGDTVAVVGAGPIGLAAIMAARLVSPSMIVALDPAPSRRKAALLFGADAALPSGGELSLEETVTAATDAVAEASEGLGFDVAIEAVGIPDTFELCTRLVRPGGRVANVGVHGSPAPLHLEDLWIRDVTITTGLVDTYSTPTLLRMLSRGQLDPSPFVTHRFGLDEMQDAYDAFAHPEDSGALKAVLFGLP